MEQRKDHQQNDQVRNAQSNEQDKSSDRQTTSGNQATTSNGPMPNNQRSTDTSTKTGVTGSDYDGQVTP